MTNQSAVQVETKVLSGRVPRPLYQEAVIAAVRRDMNKSDLVNTAVEHWLAHVVYPCPFCAGPTTPHPDALMEGVRYCEACDEPVYFTAGGGNGSSEPAQEVAA